MYPAELVNPMRKELSGNGFEELRTGDEVDAALESGDGTVLVVVNSVCGCAAGAARPGVLAAVTAAAQGKHPSRLTTVFAGVDQEAVARARSYMLPYPPSSPAIALFKNGQLVHFIERRMIEGRTAQMIAANLVAAFDEHC
jgi:putative YphP/YqiW family bacilliredoxin